jgi:uncharacterized membrane protein (DUF4010 family)
MQPISTISLGGFVVALGVGLLIGADRERMKGSGPGRGPAGVRTFALMALLGATAATLQSPVLIAVFGAAAALLAAAAYLRTKGEDPGITTEVALVLTYALGALAIGKPELAAGLGVLVALLLASRSRLHDFIDQRLSDREELDGILLAAAALIVLPLLPDHAVDPYGVVNPQVIWRLTVAVLVVNAFGYVALRTLGPNAGLAAAGFFGGFISSAATIGTLGRRARAEPALARSSVAGAALSSVATVVLLALILAIANRELLARLAFALSLMGIVAALYGLLFFYMAARKPQPMHGVAGRAFQLGYAFIFALAVTVLLLVCAFLADRYGAAGATIGIALAGFGDAHSAAASAARLLATARLDESSAVTAMILAVSANSVTKIIVAFMTGGWPYARALGPGIILMLAAFSVSVWL